MNGDENMIESDLPDETYLGSFVMTVRTRFGEGKRPEVLHTRWEGGQIDLYPKELKVALEEDFLERSLSSLEAQ